MTKRRSATAARWPSIVAAAAMLAALLAAPWPGAVAAALLTTADGAEVHSGAMRIRVTAITDDILRVRIAATGEYAEDASWAVPADVRGRFVTVRSDAAATPSGAAGAADAASVEFRTAALAVRINASPLQLIVSDLDGRVISADAPDRAVRSDGTAFTLRKVLPPAEHYFGLGDKTGPLDHRGQVWVDWNTDAYGFQESTDPIYKSIPFFVAAGGPGGSYGILLDNTWRSWFDFGKKNPDRLEFGSDGGPIDYYLIHGPTTKSVVERYTDLTGRPALPPLWALGFQQSRYSYLSATEVKRVAARLRTERIPADVIWLDIDYQDRNRPFTTNPVTFPDLPGLAKGLKEQGLRLVAITDLHIAAAPHQGYAPYDSGMAGGHFLNGADGSLYVAPVWPGPSVFPDFTRKATREWWGGLYRGFVTAGIAGFWNDMNEPAIFESPTKTMPLDNQHRIAEPGFAPRTAMHAEIHNIYGMQNSRATYEGLQKIQADERPFVLTRASYAGGQRYAATWTGDNSATWNHLKLSIAMLLNLGLSGFAYSGADVGGFVGSPSPELLTRWIEIASFTPLFRVHSVTGSPPREPWVDGPRHTDIRRRYIEQRYRLLPYIYALADENARTGAPLMRPVFYDYPEALDAPCEQPNAFLLGRELLIAPPPNLESSAAYEICLPAGGWYDYWSGSRVEPAAPRGGVRNGDPARLPLTATLDRLPVFVRAGAILPTEPLIQSTAETPQGALTLDVYPGPDCRGTIYLDDGHSLAYTRLGYLRQTVRCLVTPRGVDLDFAAREGDFKPWWRQITVRLHAWHGVARAELNGAPVGEPVVTPAGVAVTIADSSRAAHLSFSHP